MVLATMLAMSASAQNLSWHWANPQPHGNDIVDMVCNGTLAVQVAELGQLYTSPDFSNWYSQNTGTTNDLQGVTFFGNRMVICGANGLVGYSDDGVNFTSTIPYVTTNWLTSVAASSNMVVAVGDNGTVYTSSNGANWIIRFNGTTTNLPGYTTANDNWLTSVAYGTNVFVLVSDGGNNGTCYVANSGDGIHWTNQSASGISGNLERIVYVNSASPTNKFPYPGFWTVSDDGTAYYSTNRGINWNKFSSLSNNGNSTNVLYAIATDTATGLVAGDNEAQIGRNPLGNTVTWNSQIGTNGSLGASYQLAAWPYYAALWKTNGSYQLAGSDGFIEQSGTTTNGGYYWTNQYNCPRDWLWQMTVANGLYIAVGDNGRIMTSDNGADWSIEAFTTTNSIPATSSNVLFCVGGNTNLIVAAGNQGSLLVSPNFAQSVLVTNTAGLVTTNSVSTLGVAWYALSAPAATTNDLAGVGVFSNKFYLVGGNGTILRLNFTNWPGLNKTNLNASLGGTNWTKMTAGTTNYLSGITVFTNGLVVGGDQGNLLTSPDGVNWTKRTTGTTNWLFRVHAMTTNLLLAAGENGVLFTSTNSVNWSQRTSGTTNWLNDAVMVSNTCYVVGNNGTVLASTNFTSWTNVPTITTRSLYAAAVQNGQLVVAGIQGTILQSQVVPITTPVNFVSYAQSSGLNVFSVAGVVNQKFTLDSRTNLISGSWTTGPTLNLIYGDGSLLFYQSVPTNTPAQFYRCTLSF